MIHYVFKDEPIKIKNAKMADPQAFGEALSDIAAIFGGHLKPEAVVDAARDEAHVLHQHFEWDDAVAAHGYRLRQAREIVRLVCVLDEKKPDQTPRAFLSVSDKGGVSYRPLTDVMGSAELQSAVLQSAERDLKAFEVRYKQLTEVCEIVSSARQKVVRRRQNIEGERATAA